MLCLTRSVEQNMYTGIVRKVDVGLEADEEGVEKQGNLTFIDADPDAKRKRVRHARQGFCERSIVVVGKQGSHGDGHYSTNNDFVCLLGLADVAEMTVQQLL